MVFKKKKARLTEAAAPALLDKHVVLDFSRGTKTGQGSLHYDRESGNFNQIWSYLADFEGWCQEQGWIHSIELSLAKLLHGINYVWKWVYKCGWGWHRWQETLSKKEHWVDLKSWLIADWLHWSSHCWSLSKHRHSFEEISWKSQSPHWNWQPNLHKDLQKHEEESQEACCSRVYTPGEYYVITAYCMT